MVVLGKARVSSVEQAQNSHALEQQKQRLIDAGCTEIIEAVEPGSSKRHLQALIDRCKKGDVVEVVATRIDRITRKLNDLKDFADFCLKEKINLRILDQHLDLKTSSGRLMLNVLGSLAEWELDLLKERVNHGWKYLRSQKRAPGVVPFGYRRVNDRYEPDFNQYKETGKTRFEVAREIIDTFLEVQTVRGTARQMTERYGQADFDVRNHSDFPREVGLKYWLQNPVLRGHLAYFYRHRESETIVIRDQHQALISEAEWLEVDRLLKFVSTFGERDKTKWKVRNLAGLIYCGYCGSKCKAIADRHKKYRWYCSARYLTVPTCTAQYSILDPALEELVIQSLVEKSHEIATLDQDEIEEVEDTIEILKLKESLAALEVLETNPIIESAKEQTLLKIEALKLEQVSTKMTNESLRGDFISICSNPAFFQSLGDGARRRYFKGFINRVYIDSSGIKSVDFAVEGKIGNRSF